MHWLSQSFDLMGAEPVIPATLVSYQDAGGWLSMADDERIRFIDRRSGDVISLRADLTTQLLALSDAAQPSMVWAQGPVYRDSHAQSGARREKYQATFEILYDSADFAVRYSLLAACWLASRALAEPWTLVLGHTAELEPLREQTGGYAAPSQAEWPTSWAAIAQGSEPECLHWVLQAGLKVPTLRRNRTLPPARSYYQGWFFRIYAADSVEPVISGGQYRDPRAGDVLHAGFGVDVEQLAQQARVLTLHAGQSSAPRVLRRNAADLAHLCIQSWDQGIHTRLEA